MEIFRNFFKPKLSRGEIQKIYRDLLNELHPDKHSGDEEIREKMGKATTELIEAHNKALAGNSQELIRLNKKYGRSEISKSNTNKLSQENKEKKPPYKEIDIRV